jgi:CRP/FNR family transcriptional regulator
VRRKIKRGTALFQQRREVHLAVRHPHRLLQDLHCHRGRRDQVTGFQMAGEVIGLDGIVNDHHTCDAVALEDAEVCVMPFDRIEEISREVNACSTTCTRS